MTHKFIYDSPLGLINIVSDETGLINLDFIDNYDVPLTNLSNENNNQIIIETKRWLDIYFKGIKPDFYIPFHLNGSPFQIEVWKILCTIPYGTTITYGEIAKIIASKRGIKQMSNQAVGQAVGNNKISIIIPCHRVIGANNNLTGYASGLKRKIGLLKLEGVDTSNFKKPKKGKF